LVYGLVDGLTTGLVSALTIVAIYGLFAGLTTGLAAIFFSNLICLFKICEESVSIQAIVVSGIFLAIIQIGGWMAYYKLNQLN
ncbi:MAG: hypothetical protein ACTSPV_01300, partial [Candidatus Hodarchaeales archaeon]